MSGTAVRANDLLLNITGGSIGRCCIVSSEFCPANVSQHVAIIRPVIDGTQGYLHQLILSPYFQLFVMSEQTGAGRGGLPKNRMDRIPVALPPLEEQQRIVARVDELMALCDRLEAAQRERESRRDQLAASTHHHLNNGADAEALRSHAQFFIGYLPRFTARPDQIKQLRQTILNLAVRGKLVLQNKDDEPVSALVERILAEQKEFIRNRTLKDRRLSAQEADSEFFLDIPQTWQMVYLGNLIVFGPQNGISPTESSRPDAPRAITLTATTSGMFKPEHFKRIEANIPIDSEMWLREGDLLFQRGNTRDYVGIAARYEGKSGQFLYPDLMIKVRVSQSVDLRFVHICSTSPHARNYFGKNATGAQATMPKINHEILVNLPIPLPPLAEQHRIVAKVDELMAWCDQLETNLTTAQTESARLLESVLHYALQALA
jgi:type I restriction enzyme S subunit